MSPAEQTAARRARILELTDKGVAPNDIAYRLHIAPSTVSLILRQAGRPYRTRKTRIAPSVPCVAS